MPANRLLGTLLRSLQTYTDQQDTPRLLGAAASLITSLNNPLNVTLLTSQLLTAPAIWAHPEGLQTCSRCLSVFHSAARAQIEHETARKAQQGVQDSAQPQLERTLPTAEWLRAVINGADERSPRWRHVLVLGGLLLGLVASEESHPSSSIRNMIERAFTTATNLAAEEVTPGDELGQAGLTFVLNHCFPQISDHERARLDYDLLLPHLLRSTLRSPEGLGSGYWLGAIDLDIRALSKTQFQWAEGSPSFSRLKAMLQSPLLASLGPLSRFIATAIEHVKQPGLVTAALDALELFSRSLHAQWRQNRLSEIEPSEESMYLDKPTLEKTLPALWQLLKSVLFATIVILRSIFGRLLGDGALASDCAAPRAAIQALHTLRNLFFVTSRTNSTGFAQYQFVNLTATDVLAPYSSEVDRFLEIIKPNQLGEMPQHPLDRCLDLYFLNQAEHFTFIVSVDKAEDLLIAAAIPYLSAGGNQNLSAIFEAAHSLMLATFSAPQCTMLTSKHLPFYVDALFKAFPRNVSARQFRFAYKTLVQLTTPPSILSSSHPLLPATLLELLHERSLRATTVPIPQPRNKTTDTFPDIRENLSEQAVLTLTSTDILTELPLDLLVDWLPIAAEMVNRLDNVAMREHCKEQFWHQLVDSGMDPERSAVCHAWWSTAGGRQLLISSPDPDPSTTDRPNAEVSGALRIVGNGNKL